MAAVHSTARRAASRPARLRRSRPTVGSRCCDVHADRGPTTHRGRLHPRQAARGRRADAPLGDQSVDGWVEYLPQLLQFHGFSPVGEPGIFDEATLAAVRAFQDRKNREQFTPSTCRVTVDGIVGNQTWALLREEDARPPSTDGLEPHTFVESGREARWFTEDNAFIFFDSLDVLRIQGVSTGDTPIEPGAFNARFLVVLPDAETIVREARNSDPLQTRSFSFQAFMPAELGGDTTESFNVTFP